MRFENEPRTANIVFLFAHQDDEFGVFQIILDEVQAGKRVCCAYMTNGTANGAASAERNMESLHVLQRLGVREQDVYFPGTEIDVPDGELVFHLQRAKEWIAHYLSPQLDLQRVYIPAWEGGHPDHDALHAIVVRAVSDRNNWIELRQFSLYNGYKRVGPFFSVLSPLTANGPTVKRLILFRNRILFLRCCFTYRSQAASWLGLFPFVLLHYVFSGTQETQEIIPQRIEERPHEGALYYERRGMITWQQMHRRLSDWKSSEIV